jgi:hypothetical protein
MTLGERCDEIMRLIDDTLSDVAADSARGPHAPASLSARVASAARTAAAARPGRLPDA